MIKSQIIQLTIIILRSRKIRRKLMLAFTLITLFYSFLGAFIIDNLLGSNLLLFSAYWFFALALVLLMVLMALYDILKSKAEITEEAKNQVDKIIEDINRNVVKKNSTDATKSK
ncbi:MAG: hypothetical protein ACPHOG_06025 [Verrucomicrobiales bacterium]|jgi:uncharacterized membrane protein YfcA|nr:hypothetical protein [Verrucomicrobiales bacterium]MEC7637342.1 hypothetical protein [Verrucomicrobiota bacterium]|tara:strand:- start:1819 stop:2160 length:342 start_codon:yes stop_codon:yes gene_type:complete